MARHWYTLDGNEPEGGYLTTPRHQPKSKKGRPGRQGRSAPRKEAYVFWQGGLCNVLTYPGQIKVCSSAARDAFRRATRRARNLGYDVRVYCDCWLWSESERAKRLPRDATRVGPGGYTLPARR